jgi:hypothetical protein
MIFGHNVNPELIYEGTKLETLCNLRRGDGVPRPSEYLNINTRIIQTDFRTRLTPKDLQVFEIREERNKLCGKNYRMKRTFTEINLRT